MFINKALALDNPGMILKVLLNICNFRITSKLGCSFDPLNKLKS
jgi:hypothetical protein